MALTKDFRETVKARADRDPEFRRALLAEAVQAFIEGDVATGKTLLRNCVNATVGFASLGRTTNTPEKSLMRMLGPKGNPSANNLFPVLASLQADMGARVVVSAEAVQRKRTRAKEMAG